MAVQAEIQLNPVVRGDDMLARQFVLTVNGSAPAVQSATFRVHGIYHVACTVSGATVTAPLVHKTVTSGWVAGVKTWDLQVVIAGISKTWFRGTLPVLPNEK